MNKILHLPSIPVDMSLESPFPATLPKPGTRKLPIIRKVLEETALPPSPQHPETDLDRHVAL